MQKTLGSTFTLKGVGLHTGEVCSVKIYPSEQFGYRVRLGDEFVLISHSTLQGGVLGSNISMPMGEVIKTVEHFLSALYASGVTNADFEVSGGEMPIMDGSSVVFLDLIETVGVRNLGVPIVKKRLSEEVLVSGDDGKFISIKQRDDYKKIINVAIDFDHPVVDDMPQAICYEHSVCAYKTKISLARTFGFQKDIERLLAQKLCIGGSTKNAVVISDDGILNPDGLRVDNELVAHKLLDVLGDLCPVLIQMDGYEINAFKPGHALNNQLLKKVSG
ncbi:UDP-3-O-(3-hydroxymyristoyl) N-acetylglucosamine deacetylase [Vibrio chagasii]|nr:UDP-3-O-(3-hydroxymyristoyl) N-acetylglucosamine deacetylase [Vibrio chagasii]